MLRIDIQTMHPDVSLCCTGRLVLGLEAETLRCMATGRGEKCLKLELSGIRSIDAAGLGLLVELHCWAERRGKTLQVVNPSHCVCRLIAITNLQSVLQIVGCERFDDIVEYAGPRARTERAMTA